MILGLLFFLILIIPLIYSLFEKRSKQKLEKNTNKHANDGFLNDWRVILWLMFIGEWVVFIGLMGLKFLS